jgi:hypothetical protein
MCMEEESLALRYVVYMEDGNGQEFFLTEEQLLIALAENPSAKPFVVKTIFQVYEQLHRLRKLNPNICRFFALEYSEFNERRTNG